MTLYWVLGAGSWDNVSTAHWSAASGGVPGAGPPTIADAVVFDANSGLNTGFPTVSFLSSAVCGGLTIGGITNSGVTFAVSSSPVPWGAGTYSFQGASQGQRLLIAAGTGGTQRTLTINGTFGAMQDVIFRDVRLAGTAGTLTGTRIGDAGGNAGPITFDASATQTWQGTAGGAWSDPSKWTSRVPLPQDDVVIASAFAASQTITLDVFNACRTLNSSGATGSPTLSTAGTPNFYGGLDTTGFGSLVGFTGGIAYRATGRSDTFKTGAGHLIRLTVFAPGSTITLLSHWTGGGTTLSCTIGIFDANGFNVTTSNMSASGNALTGVRMGSGTWTLTGTGTLWTNVGTIFDPGTATIVVSDTGALAKTFNGNGRSYGTLRHIAAGGAALTITGNNTFTALDLECTTARTITLPAGGQQTITGALTLAGASGQPLTVVSSTPGTVTTLLVLGTQSLTFASPSADVVITASQVKTVDGLARVNVKTVDGLPMSSVKTVVGVA